MLPATRSTTTEAIAPYHRPAIRKIDAFVLELGGGHEARGRERFLAGLLLTAHEDTRLNHLVELVEIEPRAAGRTLGELAILAGFRAGELIKILKETGLLVAQTQAVHIVAEALPAIAKDIATRAQNHYDSCPSCEGTGKVTPDPTKDVPNPEPETCKPCRGRGVILVPADFDRQDRVLEITRMLPSKEKGPGVMVGVNVGNPGRGTIQELSGLFSKIVAATDRIMHPDGSKLPERPPEDSNGREDIVDGDVVSSDRVPETPPPDPEP